MLNPFLDVFRSLHSHDVKYVVIGGIAVILHGVPRATFDLDILIAATPENARRLLAALEDANLGTASLTTAEDIVSHEVSIFRDRIRVDVQTVTPGLTFENAWKNRQSMEFEKAPVFVASLKDLLASKQAAGRPIDLDDVKLLKTKAESG